MSFPLLFLLKIKVIIETVAKKSIHRFTICFRLQYKDRTFNFKLQPNHAIILKNIAYTF